MNLSIFYSRCFNVVSSASKDLISLFGFYTIKDINDDNYCDILEVLTNTMRRSYGLDVKLNLQFFTCEISCIQMKEMLTVCKENIISLGIQLSDKNDYSEILLEPDLELTNVQRLDISFREIDTSLCVHKNITEAILARYGDKLEHLGVKYLELPKNNVLQVPHLSELKSLSLDYVDENIVRSFVDSIVKENITHLSLRCYTDDMGNLDNLKFPKLEYLKLGSIAGESALELIKFNKDTITTLILEVIKFEHIGDVNIPFQFREVDIGNVNIPNLEHLELIGNYREDIALSFIISNMYTITKLLLAMVDFRNASLPVVEMPRLKCLYLRYFKDEISELMVMKAFGRKITELWMFDRKRNTYVRKSTNKLISMKKKALALKVYNS